MTALEQAVWAVAYVVRGSTLSIENADAAVASLRAGLEQEHQAELLADAKAMHQTRVVTSERHGGEIHTVRCSCGYEPSPCTKDADELMALHMAYVRALHSEDVKTVSAPADVSTSTEHEYLASYSGGREVGCHLCRRPRSAHKE